MVLDSGTVQFLSFGGVIYTVLNLQGIMLATEYLLLITIHHVSAGKISVSLYASIICLMVYEQILLNYQLLSHLL